MKRPLLACLLAFAAPLASACESPQGMPAVTPHWTYAKTSADGTRIHANFRADDQGKVVYFSTEVQHANGDHYFGQGTPTPEDVALLKDLTTQAAIDALYPNLVIHDAEQEALRDAITAQLQVSLWPQGCSWPVSEQCHQILGSVSLSPKNPAVDRLDQFFVEFTHRNRGVKAGERSSAP